MCFPEQRAQPPARTRFADVDYPEAPYPGARPDFSFVQLDGTGHPLAPDATVPSGWRVHAAAAAQPCLDRWLADRGAAPLRDRRPVLAYGSNACPSKITWLREQLGLAGPAVVLRARCTGLAAVWATGLRARGDGQRPAVLAAAPGIVEHHAVWLATPEQRRVLDECEGRGARYRLVCLHGPERIGLEDGSELRHVLAYAGASRERAPLLVEGRPVRCAEVDQRAALGLSGAPAAGDGLVCAEITGEPPAARCADR
ncbi:gamma-glutamylcyclotransferase [Saccharopolyspora shandongensis]|uniref:gamma-glutamylcyclotransferase n=1 Tax=Saccharopolyspora shandongensis TaxID=418495 RepID=UPI0033F24845